MNIATFNSLMIKLNAATWAVENATSDTKKFTTKINSQTVNLYNVENGPLYINDLRPSLTDNQVDEVLTLVDDLIVDFNSDIQDATNTAQQELDSAIQTIIA